MFSGNKSNTVNESVIDSVYIKLSFVIGGLIPLLRSNKPYESVGMNYAQINKAVWPIPSSKNLIYLGKYYLLM